MSMMSLLRGTGLKIGTPSEQRDFQGIEVMRIRAIDLNARQLVSGHCGAIRQGNFRLANVSAKGNGKERRR
jgi:hypothetical protein